MESCFKLVWMVEVKGFRNHAGLCCWMVVDVSCWCDVWYYYIILLLYIILHIHIHILLYIILYIILLYIYIYLILLYYTLLLLSSQYSKINLSLFSSFLSLILPPHLLNHQLNSFYTCRCLLFDTYK